MDAKHRWIGIVLAVSCFLNVFLLVDKFRPSTLSTGFNFFFRVFSPAEEPLGVAPPAVERMDVSPPAVKHTDIAPLAGESAVQPYTDRAAAHTEKVDPQREQPHRESSPTPPTHAAAPRTQDSSRSAEVKKLLDQLAGEPYPLLYGSFQIQGGKRKIKILGTSFLKWAIREIICSRSYGDLSAIPLQPGDVGIDLGANIGMFSVFLALAHPQIKIFAYEASPITALIAKENVRLNGLQNRVFVESLAVTSDGRDIQVTSCITKDMLSRVGRSLKSRACRGKQKVVLSASSVSFQSIVGDNNITRLGLLKMDCEGCECDVLPQIHALGDKFAISNVVGECHPEMSTQTCLEDCRGFLPASAERAGPAPKSFKKCMDDFQHHYSKFQRTSLQEYFGGK